MPQMKNPVVLLLFVILFIVGCQTLVPASNPKGTAVTLTATPKPAPTPVGQEGTWDLLFQDEFDGTTLDSSKWTTCYWWDNAGCTISSNNELEWYQPNNVLITDGYLRLQARRQTIDASNGKTYPFTS